MLVWKEEPRASFSGLLVPVSDRHHHHHAWLGEQSTRELRTELLAFGDKHEKIRIPTAATAAKWLAATVIALRPKQCTHADFSAVEVGILAPIWDLWCTICSVTFLTLNEALQYKKRWVCATLPCRDSDRHGDAAGGSQSMLSRDARWARQPVLQPGVCSADLGFLHCDRNTLGFIFLNAACAPPTRCGVSAKTPIRWEPTCGNRPIASATTDDGAHGVNSVTCVCSSAC